MKYTSLGSGYLYKIKDGQLVEYAGDIVINEKYADMLSNISRGRAYFRTADLGLYSIKKFTVCVNEGEVYNCMVWLHASDRKRAAEIFRNYSARKIAELGDKLLHYQKIRDKMNDLIFDSLEV